MKENYIIYSITGTGVWQESREAPQKCAKYSLLYTQIIYNKHLTDSHICLWKAQHTGGIYEEKYKKNKSNDLNMHTTFRNDSVLTSSTQDYWEDKTGTHSTAVQERYICAANWAELVVEYSPIIIYYLIFMDPCIVDYSVEIPTRCSFVIEFIILKFIEGSTCFERHNAHHQEL
jgi:hypothetical protein